MDFIYRLFSSRGPIHFYVGPHKGLANPAEEGEHCEHFDSKYSSRATINLKI